MGISKDVDATRTTTELEPRAAQDPLARLLALNGAVLMTLGLLSGGLIAGAMTGALAIERSTAVAAHLNGILGSFLLLGIAWTLPMLGYGPVGRTRLAHGALLAAWANWAVTVLKAFVGVAGVAMTGEPANDAIFVLLNLTVVVPSLVVSVTWVIGLRRNAST